MEDPILIFALAMIIFLTAPLVLEHYKLPGIIGIILVGAAIGPNGTGILARDQTFILLGEVGIVYLMFVAGLEINLTQFIEYKDRSIVFGLLSFLIPQIAGTVAGMAVLGLTFPAALLFGAIFSSHTLLAYPVVNRLGIAKNEAMTATIGGTILTDTLALLVLAVVVASVGGILDMAFWLQLGVGLALFFGGVWFLVPRIGRWFFRAVDQESYFDFLFVMTVLFVSAFLAELIGVKHIIGAFLAGLALNRLVPTTGPLMNRIEFVGNALFIPFFLLSVGMLVNVRVLFEGVDTAIIATSLLVLVLITKFVAAWITGRIYRYDSNEVLGMFGLSVGQAAAALAIVLIGFDEGVPGFDQHMINAVVLMILVISLISPALVTRAGTAIRQADARREYDPMDGPRRIMVPFSRNSRYKTELLNFALLLRGSETDEPLYTVSVVEPGAKAPAELAEVEESLAEAEEFAAGAEVPVESRTVVQQNPATGIVRAMTENRISTLVIGWDGARSRRQSVFGSVIDQVIRGSDQLVVVTRTRKAVEPTDRLVVLLPPDIEYNRGFADVIRTILVLAEQLNARIHGIVIAGSSTRTESLFEQADSEVQKRFETTDDWKQVLSFLRDDVTASDMVVCVSARRGTMGWHDQLQTLPKSISTLVAGNFAIVYPANEPGQTDRKFFRMK